MKKNNPKKVKVRLNLDLTLKDGEILDENVKLDDSASRVEVIRKALRLHNAVLKLQGNGGKFIFRSNEGENTVYVVL